MNQFQKTYSKYYDLFYANKDYKKEVDYINKLIKDYSKNAKNILDLGCGTGIHAQMFNKKGYEVHGLDISKDMLDIAKEKENKKLTFSVGNIQNFNLEKKFDVITSLFHVISYQNTNEELTATLQCVQKHLNKNGIFIFDFWYGPAVLTNLPETKIKKLENEEIKITRIANPKMYAQKNLVKVIYDIFIKNKKSKHITNLKEKHTMRYLFDTELELICKNLNLKVINKYEWQKDKTPDFNSWNVVWILRK